MKNRFYVVFLAVLLVVSVNSAYALGELGMGTGGLSKWIHPRLAAIVEYNDNVFLDAAGEKSDTIYRVNAGFGVSVPFSGGQHSAGLDYNIEGSFFSKFDNQNSANHNLNASLGLNFPKFYVKANDTLRPTSSRSGTEFTNRIERIENNSGITLGSQDWNNMTASVGYSLFYVAYLPDAQKVLNRQDHVVNAALSYQILPKTRAVVDYSHSFIGYGRTTGRDGDSDQANVGLTGELLAKLSGTVKVGYLDKRYTGSTQNFKTFVYNGSLSNSFSPQTSVALSFEKGARESSYSSNNFYSYNMGTVQLTQALFFQRLGGTFNFSAQTNDYPKATTEAGITRNRADMIYSAGANFDYGIREGLSAGVGYQYNNRDSNAGSFDYAENSISLKISATF